jgi:putative flippase GtrA
VLRNSVAGAAATSCDYAAFTLLASVLGLRAAIATAIGCVLGGAVNFALNRAWAFSSSGPLARMAQRYVVISGASAVLNTGFVLILLELGSLPSHAAWWLARGVVYFGWNYPLQKHWVFQHGKSPRADDPAAS